MKKYKLLLAAIGIIFTSGLTKAQVNIPIPCHAEFTVTLDSLPGFPFLYHFTDHSTGNIDSWLWEFGDGKTSTEQNPSHQFDTEGNYQICLTVSNTTNPDSCSDLACHGIFTEEYYSLGGLVYAGDDEYPLNNPLPEGDTGIASLYRISENQVVFVEDHFFTDLGYYWFGYVLPGKYLVKITLTEQSTHYGKYFITYTADKVNWPQAGIIDLSSASNYEAEIRLVPVQDLPGGIGIIRGYVNFEQPGEINSPPVAQTTVILADENQTPLTYTYTDAAGYFEFTGIPFGNYFLSADATGKPSTIVAITLTENAPIAQDINLTIFGGNAFGIPEDLSASLSVTRIYPNPILDELSAQVYSSEDLPVGIQVVDMVGKVYYTRDEVLEKGLNQWHFNATSLPPGIYMLAIYPQGKSIPVAVKFIK